VITSYDPSRISRLGHHLAKILLTRGKSRRARGFSIGFSLRRHPLYLSHKYPEPERVSPDEGVSYWQGGEITYVRTPAWGQRCTGALRSFSTDFYERF
jgi:hypothetical protein